MNQNFVMWMKITDETGFVVFEGNEGHFSDCFFSNVSKESVQNWVDQEGLFVEFSSITNLGYI